MKSNVTSSMFTRFARVAVFGTACSVLWLSQPNDLPTALGQDPVATDAATTGEELPVPAPTSTPVLEENVPATPVEPAPVSEPVIVPAAAETPAVEEALPMIRPLGQEVQAPATVQQQALPMPVEEEWEVQIIPGPSRKKPLINGLSYEEVYNSIPYRQAEYYANPSYRHDATMEILFGQLRPTTIVRNQSPERIVNEKPGLTSPYRATPSDYFSYPWSGYMFPYSLFPYPGMPGMLSPRLTY